jgi:hypothetical protein
MNGSFKLLFSDTFTIKVKCSCWWPALCYVEFSTSLRVLKALFFIKMKNVWNHNTLCVCVCMCVFLWTFWHWRAFSILSFWARSHVKNVYCLSVRPSVRIYEDDSHWTDFCAIQYLGFVLKFVHTFRFLVQSSGKITETLNLWSLTHNWSSQSRHVVFSVIYVLRPKKQFLWLTQAMFTLSKELRLKKTIDHRTSSKIDFKDRVKLMDF